MTTGVRSLATRRGTIPFPAYIPVTTYGDRYPLDRLVGPYLPRLAPAVMVSYHYAQQMQEPPRVPILVDSGGFASLFENAQVIRSGELGVIELSHDHGPETLCPEAVLEFQERVADVAFTLDFPIPTSAGPSEGAKRMELTIANALWALANRRRKDLPLYACIQGWDVQSARECARALAGGAFDGFAVGGLVPRAQDRSLVLGIVDAVREQIGDRPLHVFGLGKPETVAELFRSRVDSVDSSSYVKLAADGKLWSRPDLHIPDPSSTERLHLALCNLAAATGRALPLSAAGLAFSTLANAAQRE